MHSSMGLSVSAETIAAFLVGPPVFAVVVDDVAVVVDGVVDAGAVVVVEESSDFRCSSNEFVCRRDLGHLCFGSAKKFKNIF